MLNEDAVTDAIRRDAEPVLGDSRSPTHPAHIEANPRIRTCSPACSKAHGRALRRAWSAQWYAAVRAVRTG